MTAFAPELDLLLAKLQSPVRHQLNAPYIPFRSLSDLAGGGEGENEMKTFLSIAADNSARMLLAFLDAWTP